MLDPAVIDRSKRYIGPVDGLSLPGRDMTISGIDEKAAARILSKHPKGPTTRFVELPAGWGARRPGAFTADVELFVIKGALVIDGRRVGPHCLVTMEQAAAVGELRTEHGLSGLLFTGAPVRFAAGSSEESQARVLSFVDRDWEIAGPGMLAKTMAGPVVTSRLVMAGHVATTGWTRHSQWSERFVLTGRWREQAATGEDPGEPILMGAGSYLSRPAGVGFDGPGGGTDTTAVFLDRVVAS